MTALTVRSRLRIKVAAIVVAIMITLFFFRHAIQAFSSSDTLVDGVRIYSPFVSGGGGNGYAFYILHNPYLATASPPWKPCASLYPSIRGYLKEASDMGATSSIEYFSQSSGSGYSAYLKLPSVIIFVRGFPDFGGQPPSDAEKKVCSP